jgi:hypothetical protein
MSKIFINYRRDSAGYAQATSIVNFSSIFSKDRLFTDVDGLEPLDRTFRLSVVKRWAVSFTGFISDFITVCI